ncbi:hypothetical protein EYZ11_008562 [Aspergillus tanneri]|uniref:Uncharacterized protein n=1 Tax=Aspergillus tanneri TaxID=1220188 RepID=A0A4S3JAL5_9EURO|nr:hypothetical protein EYZ11_008562 [Aspergillus tanneri]
MDDETHSKAIQAARELLGALVSPAEPVIQDVVMMSSRTMFYQWHSAWGGV